MDSRLTSLLPKFAAVPLAFLLYAASAPASADTYYLPGALSRSPFNCSGSGQDYNCGSIDLDKDTTLVLNGPVRLQVSGNFSTNKNLSTVNNGNSFDVSVGGSVDLQKDIDVTMNLTVGGSVDIAKDARFTGNITAGGNVHFAKDSIYDGDVTVGGFLDVDKNTYITGICRAGATNFKDCGAKPPAASLHHLRINHNGSGLTCQPSSVTIYACTGSDSSGICTPYTGGASGTLQAVAGGLQASANFTIPSGISAITVNISVTTAQTVLLGIANQSPASTTGATCWNGSAADCTHDFADTGFKFDVPNHQAATEQIVPVTALYKNPNNSQQCSVAYANVTRQLTFSCNYTNPASGTKTVTLSDANAAQTPAATCTPGGGSLNLYFNGSGQASLKLVYPDVGQINIAAFDAASSFKGSDSFTAAPASYRVDITPAAPYQVAGVDFDAKVSALNALGNVTANFGKESPATTLEVDLLKCSPATGSAGVFATASNNSDKTFTPLRWSEAGMAVLTAAPISGQAKTTYLSSGVNANIPDCSANKVEFIPHHFDVSHTGSRKFYYSGENINALKITALNAQNVVTNNYMLDGLISDITLTPLDKDGNSVSNGTLSITKLDNGSNPFKDGAATIQPAYTFTNKLTEPQDLRIRADEKTRVSSKNGSEAVLSIRSGRLRMSNAFGNNKTDLKLPLRAEYWSGQVWTLNNLDNTTAIPVAAVAVYLNGMSGAKVDAPIQLTGGQGALVLQPPKESKGYIDIALNLGGNAPEQSCLNQVHASNAGAQLPWLRSRWSCAASYDRDPSARASYGANGGESKANVHTREVFN